MVDVPRTRITDPDPKSCGNMIAYPTTIHGIWRFIPHRGDYIPRSEAVGECSENFNFCHKINYLLTGSLVPHHEILSPSFLRTDLVSVISVHTSNSWAWYFTVRPLHPVNK